MRKRVGSMALLATAGLLAALSLLSISSCDPCEGSLDPIECTDLCEQVPAHAECEKCRVEPFDGTCPQCLADPPMPGCLDADANASDASTDASMNDDDSGSAATGGTSGVGGAGTSGGAGGMNGMSGGAGGMTGGSGGSPSVSCDTSENCPPTMPVCGSEDECGACTASTQCTDREATPHCATASGSAVRGQCVECTGNAHCTSNSRPECVEGACEECELDTQCPDFDAPECSPTARECGACTGDDACDHLGARDTCNVSGPAGTRGDCVECEAHADCPITAPQCDSTGACVLCEGASDDNPACMNRSATPMCNTRADAETFGECVECTGDTEDVCGGNSCKQSTGECTTTVRGSVFSCLACEADSDCNGSRKCVRHRLGSNDLGTFCFLIRGLDGCASATNAGLSPYSEATPTDSVDHHAATYCMPPTSCLSYSHTRDGETCTGNGDCGVANIGDGICSASLACTYACEQDYECPDNFSCDALNCSGP